MSTGAKRDLPRVLILDIDGVLTDGTVGMGPGGGRRVHLRDLDALTRAREAGIEVAFLTGESAEDMAWIVERCGGGTVVYGAKDKRAGLPALAGKLGVAVADVCYVGDARRDADALRLAGLGMAPCDADPLARNAASIVLGLPGGRGAVSEAVDILAGGQAHGAVKAPMRPECGPSRGE